MKTVVLLHLPACWEYSHLRKTFHIWNKNIFELLSIGGIHSMKGAYSNKGDLRSRSHRWRNLLLKIMSRAMRQWPVATLEIGDPNKPSLISLCNPQIKWKELLHQLQKSTIYLIYWLILDIEEAQNFSKTCRSWVKNFWSQFVTWKIIQNRIFNIRLHISSIRINMPSCDAFDILAPQNYLQPSSVARSGVQMSYGIRNIKN